MKPLAFHLSREAVCALAHVRERSRFQSDPDAVRLAIHVYDDLLLVSARNQSMRIIAPDGRAALYSPHLKFTAHAQNRRDAIDRAGGDKRRGTVFFSDSTPALIEAIRQSLLVTSAAEVVRNAVVVLDELTSSVAQGSKIVIGQDKNQTCAMTHIFLCDYEAFLTRARTN